MIKAKDPFCEGSIVFSNQKETMREDIRYCRVQSGLVFNVRNGKRPGFDLKRAQVNGKTRIQRPYLFSRAATGQPLNKDQLRIIWLINLSTCLEKM